ncbi:MAG: Hsp20/alpha crystallin family protein [Myxococcota bacterium]
MALIKWQPFGRYGMQVSDIDRMFERMFDDFWSTGLRKGIEDKMVAWSPSVDIEELEDKIVVRADLPGMERNEIKVSVEKDTLSISGERKTMSEEKNERYTRVERSYGSFCRTFALPTNVEAAKIEAVYKDGVLTLTLPKKEKEQPKLVEIKVD